MPKRRRLLRLLLAGIALGLVAWLSASLLVVTFLTRRPRPAFAEVVPPALGDVEAGRLTTADGHDLGFWFLPGRDDRAPALVLHGNGGCRGDCRADAARLTALGHPVLLVSLRAHGDSTGDRNDFGFSARSDVVAAVGWLANRCPGRRVVIWGNSLGAAAALFAAGDVGDRAAGYVLVSPYSDLHTATRNRTRLHLPPVLEETAYAGLVLAAPLVLPDPDAIAPARAARDVPAGVPALVLAGGADARATPADARAVTDALPGPAELLVVPGAGHLRVWATDPDGCEAALGRLLARAAAR